MDIDYIELLTVTRILPSEFRQHSWSRSTRRLSLGVHAVWTHLSVGV